LTQASSKDSWRSIVKAASVYSPTRCRGDEFEVVTIQTDHEGVGAGRALMDAARARAIELGARRM
jgi:hypothetical protein